MCVCVCERGKIEKKRERDNKPVNVKTNNKSTKLSFQTNYLKYRVEYLINTEMTSPTSLVRLANTSITSTHQSNKTGNIQHASVTQIAKQSL